MEKEMRRYERFTIDSMQIRGRIVSSKVVDILDISLGGISLKSDRRLNIGNDYILKIDEKGLRISLKATVVWASLQQSIKSANGDLVPIYSVGMKFNGSSDKEISELIKFIAPDKQRSRPSGEVPAASELRFHVRFQVGDSGKAVLTCPENYSIRTVSLGGMLIETSNVLRAEERISLEISLPDNKSIKSPGRVVSCTPIKEKPGRYAIGIEFLNMPLDKSRLLGKFIGMLS